MCQERNDMRASLRVGATLAALLLAVTGCGGDGSTGGEALPTTDATTEQDDQDGTGQAAEAEEADEDDEPTPPASSLQVTGTTQRSDVEIRAGEILTELEATAEPEGTVVEIPDTVLFDFDSSELKPEASEILDEVVEVLRLLPAEIAEIRGHTDDQGTAEYNARLSADRADAVRDYLVDAGIDASRLSTEGVGFDEPVASNDTEAGRAQNRRVEIILPTVDLDALTSDS
jgi:outer membrane protein OmpA-like peptidoglycan-associated protein